MDHVGWELLLGQMLIGAVTASAAVAVHAEVPSMLNRGLPRLIDLSRRRPARVADAGSIVIVVHVISFALVAEIVLRVVAPRLADAAPGAEPSVRLSPVRFAASGFGDVTLAPEWRFLSAIIGASGFLLFGWSTAYMVEFIRRTH